MSSHNLTLVLRSPSYAYSNRVCFSGTPGIILIVLVTCNHRPLSVEAVPLRIFAKELFIRDSKFSTSHYKIPYKSSPKIGLHNNKNGRSYTQIDSRKHVIVFLDRVTSRHKRSLTPIKTNKVT